MKTIIPINAMPDGTCRTIKVQYKNVSGANIVRQDSMGATAILEIMEEPKIIQVGNYMDDSGKGVQEPAVRTRLLARRIAPTLNTCQGGQREPKIIQSAPVSCAVRGRGDNNEQRLEMGGEIANCLTSVQKDSMVVEPAILGYTRNDKGEVEGYHEKEIANTLHGSTGSGGNTDQFVKTRYRIRKLTPTECFRLMGMDDADIDKIDAFRVKTTLKSGKVKEKPIPKSAKYKLAGNSIVVDVLYHIFYQMFVAVPPKPRIKPKQYSIFDYL